MCENKSFTIKIIEFCNTTKLNGFRIELIDIELDFFKFNWYLKALIKIQ